MSRGCCKESLDKVVDYDERKDICTQPEARYVPTHARVNNHRLLSLPLWAVVISNKLIVVKILHMNLIRMCEMWSSAIKDRAFWHGIKCLHSYSTVRAWRNRKVCATFCRCAFGLIVSNRVKLFKRDTSITVSNTVVNRYNAVQFIMLLYTVLQWQQPNMNQTLNSQKTPYHVQAMGCLLWIWGTIISL